MVKLRARQCTASARWPGVDTPTATASKSVAFHVMAGMKNALLYSSRRPARELMLIVHGCELPSLSALSGQ